MEMAAGERTEVAGEEAASRNDKLSRGSGRDRLLFCIPMSTIYFHACLVVQFRVR